ncbi:DNA-binding protein [Microbacterium bovistercoris]|uniref:DNA-binding protein n=1 Tax=Microbacterium bovistercoris TaxID=2293570 RepID=A0A371NWL2_9MICO|nr:helix-turn-helix domain-containing protein [Microbacterium bovistercoris]REJ06289.1 DNA-binding protein [Microbacterium bovistercoris]
MDELMTPEQLAEYLQVSTGTLSNDRYLGRGPRFIRVGRKIRYARADVQAYLDANIHTRTDLRAAV